MNDRSMKLPAGVFSSFSEVPNQTRYNSDEYLHGLSVYCDDRANELVSGAFPRTLERNLQNNVLASVAASMLGRRKLRILDFGGGLGQSFVAVAASIPNYARRLEYTVYDLPDTVAYAKAHDIYGPRHIKGIHFIDDLSSVPSCDLAYFGSSLQYESDWRGAVSAVSRLGPLRVLVTQTPTVLEAPTFVISQQNAPGGIHPAWIFNVDELIGEFIRNGFQVAAKMCEYHSGGDTSFLSLPTEYHAFRRVVLLFEREPTIDNRPALESKLGWRRLLRR